MPSDSTPDQVPAVIPGELALAVLDAQREGGDPAVYLGQPGLLGGFSEALADLGHAEWNRLERQGANVRSRKKGLFEAVVVPCGDLMGLQAAFSARLLERLAALTGQTPQQVVESLNTQPPTQET